MKKARKVLCSPDPEYREKVDLVLHTLQNLKPAELFFFVDELGPLRVKKYGGRTFVRKAAAYTFPQEQEYRGVMTMAGALNAITNQVTWVYARSKDTSAMIELIEILFNQHRAASMLYITWDAASWHRSRVLVEWLDTFNETTKRSREGPLIHLVPLPTSSQFLERSRIQWHEESCYTSLQLPFRAGDEGCDISALRRTQRILSSKSETCWKEDLGPRLFQRL
jgi:hypothetical protein